MQKIAIESFGWIEFSYTVMWGEDLDINGPHEWSTRLKKKKKNTKMKSFVR